MAASGHLPIEEMEMFREYVGVAKTIWQIVVRWDPLSRDTLGKQIIRAADSVGTNLIEGDGRYSDADALNFIIIARESARETRYWISLARDRSLVAADEADALESHINRATKRLNMLIRHRRATKNIGQIREDESAYDV